jgi:hypothetical protein
MDDTIGNDDVGNCIRNWKPQVVGDDCGAPVVLNCTADRNVTSVDPDAS